jgi:hypothetical protein
MTSYSKVLKRMLNSIVIFSILVIVGCATTSPNATFVQTLPETNRVDVNDDVVIKVDANQGIGVVDSEKKRLSEQIKTKIDTLKQKNSSANSKSEYEINVQLTQYEKGNAFARAMLAGLGQIHIDAHVTMLSLPERKKLAEFDVNKTFAWGGIYGASTSIEDVESGFAEGIAEAVTKAEK